jgi:glycosyltransferase involved in cell wall biosynthesis
MKLLVVTQAVDADSSTLGFFIAWLKEFSGRCDEVFVIGLSVGTHDLPANVRVLSMGKERGAGKPSRVFSYWQLLRSVLPRVDGVFIHMCPEYLIAGWPFIAASRKPVFLWYAHRQKSLRLRLAAALADVVGTISEGSFPYALKKRAAFGHGIPTDRFAPSAAPPVPGRLVAVGRIAPIKRLELLIDALALLRARGRAATLELWGAPAMPSDAAYEAALRRRVAERGLDAYVAFKGPAPYARMPEIAASAEVALNACPDGALDKAVLEAMACARPVVVTNRTFVAEFGPDAARCLAAADPAAIADRVEGFLGRPDPGLGERLRGVVVRGHALDRLVGAIVARLAQRKP